MKEKSASQSAPACRNLDKGGFFSLRVLIGLFVFLSGVFLALLSFGTFSSVLAQNGTTREQMTLALAQALAIQPPACVPGQEMFTDVPASSPFCPFIEELARSGITGGCTATKYCPGSSVTRAQMAVFIVKAMEACPTLDPRDDMIRVGGVCIDKYEASIWNAPRGGAQVTGAIPCNANGQNCTNIYARSVAGVQPRGNITWFQAQAALRNSGKRLPTNAEWQMAALGTPDGFPCNVNSGGSVATGSRPGCVSTAGVFDMVGNVWEWVADWVPQSTACPGWGPFSDDQMCLAGASTMAPGPGALFRGGAWGDGTFAGPFTVLGNTEPSASLGNVGFRGAR
jgi:Sulfatase-modifying factor enzyme 1/S-layer homology domain